MNFVRSSPATGGSGRVFTAWARSRNRWSIASMSSWSAIGLTVVSVGPGRTSTGAISADRSASACFCRAAVSMSSSVTILAARVDDGPDADRVLVDARARATASTGASVRSEPDASTPAPDRPAAASGLASGAASSPGRDRIGRRVAPSVGLRPHRTRGRRPWPSASPDSPDRRTRRVVLGPEQRRGGHGSGGGHRPEDGDAGARRRRSTAGRSRAPRRRRPSAARPAVAACGRALDVRTGQGGGADRGAAREAAPELAAGRPSGGPPRP